MEKQHSLKLKKGIELILTKSSPDCPIINCKEYGMNPICYFENYNNCPIYKIYKNKS